ncbi:MAG TPA: AI-2E family transporter [Kofleriaceae bacterium]|nr:AI-2E family transporter [Kofleriaceae bacterium]
MSPPDPPGEPPSGSGGSGGGEPPASGGIPKPLEPPGQITGSLTGPLPTTTTTRTRTGTLFSAESPIFRFLKRWGFPLFIVLVVIWGREVLLPFIFAALIAYILAPVVRAMSERKDGTRRMPRGLAIIICYLVFIGLVVGFMFLLVPRLSRDVARLGKEAPGMYKKMNEQWTPEIARWLEQRFPSLAGVKTAPEEPEIVPDVPLPPGTAFTMTPLPDGRFAIQLAPNGLDIKPLGDGAYHIHANEAPPDPLTLEDKLRGFVQKGMIGLQSKLNDLVRLGQSLLTAFIKGIFGFFFTLMIAAFMLIDLEKVHGFLRSLFPANVREDYDIIKAGIDQGLSGVIRGQLLICVVNGVLTYIGLLIFGVKYGLILAVVAGLMSLIPIFGSILSSVPIVAVALVSGDSGIDFFRGIAMTLWIIGIHFIEANLLNPKIIGTAAKIHPVFVIFALFLGEHSYGLVGALLAVPILSAIQVVFLFLYKKTWKDPARRGETGPIKRPREPTNPILPSTKS